MMRYKLVIAEKPSVAQSLSAVIGATARKDGYLEGNGWRVSWCVGHLAGLADADLSLIHIYEMHLLLKEEQTAAYTVEIWKRFRKWGGIPTGITQNVKDLLSSREVENIFENSDFVYMLNQAGGDRQILAKQLGISTHQLSYVTHSGEGEGLLFYGSTILPFVDHFPKNTELYRIMTTKPQELKKEDE